MLKCPKCKTKLKKIKVEVEDAKNKVNSYQCAKCGYIKFDKKTSKRVIGELKKKELKNIMEREKEHHLALWCMEQAKLHYEGKLSKDKVKKLKAINFPFDHYLALYNRHNMTFEEFEKDEVEEVRWKKEKK